MNNQNNKGMETVEEAADEWLLTVKHLIDSNYALAFHKGCEFGAQWAKQQSDGDRWVSKTKEYLQSKMVSEPNGSERVLNAILEQLIIDLPTQ